MHNVKRNKQTAEAVEAKRQREKAKIQEYMRLVDDVLARKKKSDFSEDAFELTTKLLQVNPEFYTIWNYRRQIMLRALFATSTPQEINTLLSDDLSVTTRALKAHPKVYWIWNHRRWCLENVPAGPTDEDPTGWRKTYWENEMFIVEKMLDMDPRNFLAWNYRRYVLAGMPVSRSELSELEYTTKKIEANFSNFSAWHQRSKVLTSSWASGRLDPVKSKEEEFELVRNAMYTDPDDQSVWLYHRWLIDSGDDKDLLLNEIAIIQELLDEQPDSKWCMDSIVRYKSILIEKHGPSVDTDSLRQECQHLLCQLIELDPARRRRYESILGSL